MKVLITTRIKNKNWIAMLALLIAIVACQKKVALPISGTTTKTNTLANIISANISLKHLDSALILTGTFDTLNSKTFHTVFVSPDDTYPTNSSGAFEAPDNFYYRQVQFLNDPLLRRAVNYQIVRGSFLSKDLPFSSNTPIPTLEGNNLYFSKFIKNSDTILLLNGKTFRYKDFLANNGVYHVLNDLLFPPAGDNLWSIISGSNFLTWEDAKSVSILNLAGNYESSGTFSNPGLNCRLFRAALQRTGLDVKLQGKDPFTVFVPGDALFLKPPIKGLDSIATMNLDTLIRIVNLYILPGIHFMNDFVLNEFDGVHPIGLKTIGKDSLYFKPTINLSNGQLYGKGNLKRKAFAGVSPIRQDIVCANGVIHFLTNNNLTYR